MRTGVLAAALPDQVLLCYNKYSISWSALQTKRYPLTAFVFATKQKRYHTLRDGSPRLIYSNRLFCASKMGLNTTTFMERW